MQENSGLTSPGRCRSGIPQMTPQATDRPLQVCLRIRKESRRLYFHTGEAATLALLLLVAVYTPNMPLLPNDVSFLKI